MVSINVTVGFGYFIFVYTLASYADNLTHEHENYRYIIVPGIKS